MRVAGSGATKRSMKMRARRIIFVNRFFYPDRSATSQLLSDLAFHLSRHGRSVVIITTRGRYDDPASILADRETVDGVEIHRVFRPRFGRANLFLRAIEYVAIYFSFAWAAMRLSERGDIIVAKTDPPLLSIALAPIAVTRSLSLVNWLQDLYPEVALELGPRAFALFATPLVAARNFTLRASKFNVAISKSMANRLHAHGHAPSRIEVISNWCDDQSIAPRADEENPIRAEWGLTKKFVVGYSGNLGRAHEYETLIDAATRLRDQHDILFLFVGGGYLTPALKREIERRGLNEAFQFRPLQETAALPQSLCAPDIHWLSLRPAMEGLILPSKFYGIAAAGKPIVAVATPDGELAALLARHECGFAIAPGDDKAFAEKILSYRHDPSSVKRHGANARRMLDESFSKRGALSRWERLLERL